MKINKKWRAARYPMAAMLLATASFTACSSDENITDNTQKQGFQLKINGYLGSSDTKSGGAGAQWEDETGAAGGGLKFKWTGDNTSEMYGGYFLANKDLILPTTNNNNNNNKCYSKINIAIDGNNPAKATLSSEANFTDGMDGYSGFSFSTQDVIFCFAPVNNPSDISQTQKLVEGTVQGANNAYFPMSFPSSFIQEEANSTKGISEYMYIYGEAFQPNEGDISSGANASAVDITFHHVPATMRYVIRNKRGETVTIKSVKMSFDSDVLPTTGQYRWETLDGNSNLQSSIYFDDTRTSSVTTLFGANGAGLSVGTTNPLLGYAVVAPSQETITGNATFIITDGDDREYVSDVVTAADLLADKTGESKFMSGYVYTVWLLLDDKLTLGGVTVNEWDETTPQEDISHKAMSLTDLCSTDTYKEQREALTTLTLNGEAITADERNLYVYKVTSGTPYFATYFPKVTTIHLTGETISQGYFLDKNEIITTVSGKDLKNVPFSSFEYMTAATSYDFPNVDSIASYCFRYNTALKTLSLPKLQKLGTYDFSFCYALEDVCFASFKDFTGTSYLFKNCKAIANLAFGTTEQMTFDEGVNATKILTMTSTGEFPNTTLYLNEYGYEYNNEADFTANTWRGFKFKAIKKYSEYTGKKD